MKVLASMAGVRFEFEGEVVWVDSLNALSFASKLVEEGKLTDEQFIETFHLIVEQLNNIDAIMRECKEK